MIEGFILSGGLLRMLNQCVCGLALLKQYDLVKGDKMDYFLVFTARP